MSLNTKYLEKLKNEQILSVFYTDNYDESDFGFVIDFNNEFLLIESYDDEYHYNGISIFFRHNITRIRWAGNELENVAKLIDLTKRQKDKIRVDLASIQTILKSVSSIYKHLVIHIQDIDKNICFVGQIHEIDEHSIIIHEFGNKSALDRKFTLLSLDDITRVDANGQYENNLLKLFQK